MAGNNQSNNSEMNQTVSQFTQDLAQYVDRLISNRINQASFDKTYAGIISAILFEPNVDVKDAQFGTYKVRFNNTEKKIKLVDGIVHEIGERVEVCVPQNNPDRIIVYPSITRVVPYKIIYDNSEDKFIEHRKIETNGQVYEIESEYKLTVNNKGKDNEEVTKMTLPDGREIEFEGWDI